MRLGIDLDGVVANFTEGWQRFYNREFGANLVVEDSQRWNDVVDLTHFNDIDEFWEWSSDLEGRSLFWHLATYPGAIESLHALDREGHDIVVITQKPRFAFDDTRDWLGRVGVPAMEVHILDMHGGRKWEVDCDVYLDDGPHIIPGLVRNRPDRLICRYVRPWNDPVEGAVDVHSWDDFRDLVASRFHSG
jgi:uncharacterized HAD superfamily protein